MAYACFLAGGAVSLWLGSGIVIVIGSLLDLAAKHTVHTFVGKPLAKVLRKRKLKKKCKELLEYYKQRNDDTRSEKMAALAQKTDIVKSLTADEIDKAIEEIEK